MQGPSRHHPLPGGGRWQALKRLAEASGAGRERRWGRQRRRGPPAGGPGGQAAAASLGGVYVQVSRATSRCDGRWAPRRRCFPVCLAAAAAGAGCSANIQHDAAPLLVHVHAPAHVLTGACIVARLPWLGQGCLPIMRRCSCFGSHSSGRTQPQHGSRCTERSSALQHA